LAPMIQALLFLVIIIVLPLYLLISQFSIGGVLHYAIFFLVLRFFTVIWAVADVYQEGLFLSLFPDIAQWGTAFTYTRNRLLLYGMSAFFYIVAPLIMTNLVFLGAGNVRQFHIGGSTDINSKLGDK
ncbi:MAG: conjugal transfer protein TraG N-terminal domain-containing protein, partial [Gammaproteobacteria bacterium]|nr:conjugal transfer protein TraG N-terminal domain-containing protein [Gammaproteobacteria bacterium]